MNGMEQNHHGIGFSSVRSVPSDPWIIKAPREGWTMLRSPGKKVTPPMLDGHHRGQSLYCSFLESKPLRSLTGDGIGATIPTTPITKGPGTPPSLRLLGPIWNTRRHSRISRNGPPNSKFSVKPEGLTYQYELAWG